MLKQLATLCDEIGMPEQAATLVLQIAPELDLEGLRPLLEGLFREELWAESLAGLVDTMDCFPRFVKEHMASFGCYGFDREWWTVHQLSGLLFRVGLLEFELRKQDIALHIPTGAHLDPEAVDASLDAIREMIADHFPRWKDLPKTCHSWLLSPSMQELLPEDAKILKFQRRFAVTLTGEDNNDFLQWGFKRKDIPYDRLPEETSLQRNLKAKLLRGEPFLDARGILME